jgi:hypothetical protein
VAQVFNKYGYDLDDNVGDNYTSPRRIADSKKVERICRIVDSG